ncbi:hypothetical protein F4777DRAFT_579406 [Nemania sp. FL0916]|nr:hypothetical protein F4777DRAFT_579406 [Nemania sp. FL0916]
MESLEMAENAAGQEKAIIRTCGYPRLDFGNLVLRSSMTEEEEPQQNLDMAFLTQPAADLGNLEKLPTELIVQVLKFLDISTYFQFLHTNRRARELATDIREYSLIVKHGLQAFRAFLRTETAHRLTVYELYLCMITENCEFCGEFGGFIYLITAQRCCYECVQFAGETHTMPLRFFTKALRRGNVPLAQLLKHSLRTSRGAFAFEEPIMRRVYLVHTMSAIKLLWDHTNVTWKKIERMTKGRDSPYTRHAASTSLPFYNLETGRAETGICCKGCHYKSLIDDPDLDNSDDEAALKKASEDRDRLYSEAGFLAHFAQDERAQDLWLRSENGTKDVEWEDQSPRVVSTS